MAKAKERAFAVPCVVIEGHLIESKEMKKSFAVVAFVLPLSAEALAATPQYTVCMAKA